MYYFSLVKWKFCRLIFYAFTYPIVRVYIVIVVEMLLVIFLFIYANNLYMHLRVRMLENKIAKLLRHYYRHIKTY